MSDVMDFKYIHSPESEMDRLIDDLLRKILDRTVTKKEMIEYQHLLANRTQSMRPPAIYARGRRLRKHA